MPGSTSQRYYSTRNNSIPSLIRIAMLFCVLPLLFLISAAALGQNPEHLIPSLPDSETQKIILENMINEIHAAARKEDHEEIARLLRTLMPPDSDEWFETRFGRVAGPALAASNRRNSETRRTHLENVFSRLASRESLNIRIVCTDPAKSEENIAGAEAIRAATTHSSMRIFSVHIESGRETRPPGLGYFGFTGESPFYLGNLAIQHFPVRMAPESLWNHRIQEPQSAKVVKILNQGLKGTVKVELVVGFDGRIQILSAKGKAALVKAATEFLGEWNFRLPVLNGEATQIYSKIKLVFRPGKPLTITQ